ncbi:MAG: amidase, partial [Muribaculaceae bacterium]|nr:amidase [Muribaculaceae bacterium]
NYDRETSDFFRWTVSYNRAELAALVKERSGIDFGDIIDLKPMSRGTSGRLIRLLIVGTKRSMIIGKELEIRRTLSPSHLYSAAFTVERKAIDPTTGVPEQIILRGAGWGHGVGLCQIGAAVMSSKGYDYRRILAHYFANAEISTCY